MKATAHPRPVAAQDPISRLSPRQLEILELLAKGLTNDEIGGVLGISSTTVRTHVTAVLGHLDVSNRTEAAAAYAVWGAGPARITAMLTRPAIAVLPLTALDDDPRARAVAGGITHDLAALFARWCWFPVIAQTSVARAVAATGPELGQRLGASFLVDGVLHTSPTTWRLAVRIDVAATGHCLWTERYEFASDDLFAVQDALCEAIVAAAYPVLVTHTEAALRHVSQPRDLAAWELAHEGMRLYAARSADTNAAAQRCLRGALEREPELVLAHFGLGLTGYDDVLNQWSPPADARERLRRCAERCTALAPHAAEGHYLLGRYFQTLGDHTLAVDALTTAVQHNPSFAAAHALLAQALQLTGRSDEAMTRMNHAAHLGPGSFVAGLATLHFARGEYRDALEIVERVIAGSPRYPYARALAAASAWWSGDVARATGHARALADVSPGFAPSGFRITFGADVEPVDRIAVALQQLGVSR